MTPNDMNFSIYTIQFCHKFKKFNQLMRITKNYLNELTYKVIGCAIEVHKILGPGLLESVYEKCFMRELNLQGIQFQKQLWVPISYKVLKLTMSCV